MSNIIKPSITTIHSEGDRYENASLRHADGSKYGYTLYIEGLTASGVEYNARVSVLIQSWTDINADGQFVVTTEATIERFKEISGVVQPEQYGFADWGSYKAHYDTLTEAQQEIADERADADEEAANIAVESFLAEILYKPEYKHLVAEIKTVAFKAHLRIK